MRSNGRDEDGRTAFGKGTWEVANASFVGSNDRGCFGDKEDMAKIIPMGISSMKWVPGTLL